jgi:hypothetical protein
MPDTMIASPAPVLSHTGIPVEIARAIGEVMTQIKSLPKGERNEHGGYAFASIDDFLAAVGPLCSVAGLIVYQDEHSIDMIDRGGKAWVKATYSFRLGHISGVICERPMLRTVFLAITGPQTMGASQSYSLKMFMRSLFMIPTGDRDDADYHRQQDMPAAQASQRSVQRVEQPRGYQPTPKASQTTQRPSDDSDGPSHIAMPSDAGGLRIREWLDHAKAAINGKPESWRRRWLEIHQQELADLRSVRPDWADRVEAAAIAPDLAEAAE